MDEALKLLVVIPVRLEIVVVDEELEGARVSGNLECGKAICGCSKMGGSQCQADHTGKRRQMVARRMRTVFRRILRHACTK